MAPRLQGAPTHAANDGGDDHLALPRRTGQDLVGAVAKYLACGWRDRRTGGGWGAARLGAAGRALSRVVGVSPDKTWPQRISREIPPGPCATQLLAEGAGGS